MTASFPTEFGNSGRFYLVILARFLTQFCYNSESCRSVVETFQLDVGSVDAVAARVGKVVRKNLGFLGFKTFYKP